MWPASRCNQQYDFPNYSRYEIDPHRPLADRRFAPRQRRTFLLNWLLARRNGWRILLRVEDLDGPRVRRYTTKAIEDLRWLGIDWDDGPVYQSARLDIYGAAIER